MSAFIGLFFLQKPEHFKQFSISFFSMQLKHADITYSNINEPLFNPIDIIFQPGKQFLF